MHSIEDMLAYENGRADYRRLSDLDICRMIDKDLVPKFGKFSVYQLTQQEKRKIAELLYRQFHVGKAQIIRCLAMKEWK